jgi:hypothetical protein
MEISYDALSPSCDGLTWLESVRTWSQEYEARYMVPHRDNRRVADETMRLLLFDVPSAAHPAAREVVSALMDKRLRRAMLFDDPPSWLCSAVEMGFRTRKYILRYAALPRPWVLRKKKVSDKPDKHGKLHQIYSVAEPWYVISCNVFCSRLTSFKVHQRHPLEPLGPRKLDQMASGKPYSFGSFSARGICNSRGGPKDCKGKGAGGTR